MREPRARRALVAAAALGCLLAGCAPGTTAWEAAPRAAPAKATPEAPDWRNATYRTTCDGLLLGGIRARFINGTATVPVDISESSFYDEVDLRLEATATGDVDGDGKPETAVLLQCAPQPSNGSVEEVHVFRADRSELAVLPSPRTLPETTILAPLYVPGGLRIQNGDIVAAMKAYGPGDSHATGPSQNFTVRWHWTGSGFALRTEP